MFGIINYESFLLAGILLNLTPGADTLYILGRSITNGKKAGIISALGIGTGSIVHTVFAALGLSIILSQSRLAFDIVKYIGASYLIFLGIQSMLSKGKLNLTVAQNNFKDQDMGRIYLSGILTNVLNPKVALFYLAFLPQFIDSAFSSQFVSFIILGLTFTITGTLWCLVIATFSSLFLRKFKGNNKIKSWMDKITGIIFISLGIKLALSKLD
jgi:threonine/homoserine/homoserine lactone efflux protein